jgi:hypothetical protein
VAQAGRSGIYEVRITDPAGETVAIFQGQSREIGGSVTVNPVGTAAAG